MKHPTKIRLFTLRFVGFVAIAAASIAVAFAGTGVTIPSTFTTGATISSSAMNANFTAVATQMPGVNVAGISNAGLSVTNGSYMDAAAVSITAPTAGYAVVRFDGYATVPVTGSVVELAASDRTNALGSIGGGDVRVIIIPSTATNLTLPFSHTRVYPVTAGAHTYFALVGGTTGVDQIYGTLTVEFFPNSF